MKATLTRDQIYALCKTFAPQYGYDPLMILAQIEQESSYNEFDPRLEEHYCERYIETDPVLKDATPSVQALMATSFGYGQLLGHSLYQLDYFFSTDSVTVVTLLDKYVGTPEDQVRTMCQWMKKKQMQGTSHTVDDALRRYNGSSDYPPLVYARYKKLKGIYGNDNLLATVH